MSRRALGGPPARPDLPPGPALPAWLQTWGWIWRPGPLLDGCRRAFGRRFTLSLLGRRSYLILSDPSDIAVAFAAPAEVLRAGRANQGFKPFLGEHSLFVLDGEEHRRHRRLLLPPFHGERMRAYGEAIRDATDEVIERLPRNVPIPIIDVLHSATLRIIFRAVFGVQDRAREDLLARLVARAMARAGAALAFVPLLRRDLGRWSPWSRFQDARADLDAILSGEIDAARGRGDREDILAKLLEEGGSAGEALSKEEARDELMTLLSAGHETTTAALAWALQWILGDRAVRSRLQDEVRGASGNGPVEPARAVELPYLRACVLESLRLSPPVPLVPRYAAEDTVLGDDLHVPAGTYVCPCPYLTQRDPDLYPEPLRFRPGRFEDGEPPPDRFFPFGGGGRACIGAAFAIHEMTVMIATVLARADLSLVGPPSPRAVRRGIILAPASGPRIVVERLRW